MYDPASILVEQDFFIRKQSKTPPVKRDVLVHLYLFFHDCAVSQGDGITVVVDRT